MSRYNHFSKQMYKAINFFDLKVGDKFRRDFFKNKRRRMDIICIKTEPFAYMEQRNKQEYRLSEGLIGYEVRSFDVLVDNQNSEEVLVTK